MTTTQHTPGPWSQGEDNPLNIYGNHASVANVHGTHPTGASTEEEAIANARLIAAAPLMLNALRVAMDAIGDTYDARDNDSQGEMIRDYIADAIAAATGEEVQA